MVGVSDPSPYYYGMTKKKVLINVTREGMGARKNKKKMQLFLDFLDNSVLELFELLSNHFE